VKSRLNLGQEKVLRSSKVTQVKELQVRRAVVSRRAGRQRLGEGSMLSQGNLWSTRHPWKSSCLLEDGGSLQLGMRELANSAGIAKPAVSDFSTGTSTDTRLEKWTQARVFNCAEAWTIGQSKDSLKTKQLLAMTVLRDMRITIKHTLNQFTIYTPINIYTRPSDSSGVNCFLLQSRQNCPPNFRNGGLIMGSNLVQYYTSVVGAH